MDWIEQKKLFEGELIKRGKLVYSHLKSEKYRDGFLPEHICDAVYSYIDSGGKALRPTLLLFCCGAVGGDEAVALPAACAVEVFHTWTLVHDDVMDRDKKRRGGMTVHEKFRGRAIDEFSYNEIDARHYGESIAMLTGDVQHGWAVSLLCELSDLGLDKNVTLHLIRELETGVINLLLEGQTLDIQFSKLPIESLNEDLVVDMLCKKTGALYEYAGKAGAMIGLNEINPDNNLIKYISQFTSGCAIAFQIQDDILGITGDEQKLGKPVGSDIREGKRTLIACHAFNNADNRQKKRLLGILGNQNATDEEIHESIDLLNELDGIEYARNLSKQFMENSKNNLENIPESKYKDLLSIWAEYMIKREF